MSVSTWEREYLRGPKKLSALRALRAELHMWEGTTQRALRKHKVKFNWQTLTLYDDSGDKLALFYPITPLCRNFERKDRWPNPPCAECPIVKVSGSNCLSAIDECTDTNTLPIRRLVRQVLRTWERKYGRKNS